MLLHNAAKVRDTEAERSCSQEGGYSGTGTLLGRCRLQTRTCFSVPFPSARSLGWHKLPPDCCHRRTCHGSTLSTDTCNKYSTTQKSTSLGCTPTPEIPERGEAAEMVTTGQRVSRLPLRCHQQGKDQEHLCASSALG